jgi:DNA-binding CsgD family transcriptional regulator
MALMKGTGILSLREFIIDRLGAGEWGSVVAALPPSDEAVLRTVTPAGWYDRELQARLIRVLASRRGDPAFIDDFGRYEAERDFAKSYRWFLRLIKPSFAVKNMNILWRRTEDTGHWRSTVDGEDIVARLYDWGVVDALLCRYLRSYLERTLEFFAGKRPIVTHTQCRAGGARACVFRTKCDLGERAPDRGGKISKADLADIAYELMDYSDLDALADAILEILRNRLSNPRITLWVRTGKDDRLTLVRTTSAAGVGIPCFFMLETRGRAVGKLSVELSSPEEEAEIIGELLPCFSVALYTVLATSLEKGGASDTPDRGPTTKGSPEEADQRVRVASERWHLSARQATVLELIVKGQTNKEIANALGCTEGNIEAHVSQILKKSGSANRAMLVGRIWSEL